MKTAELEGTALRWAVGHAEGHELELGSGRIIRARVPGLGVHAPWAPDCYWQQGGPIIDREHIHVGPDTYGPASVILNSWHAIILLDPDHGEHGYQEQGKTALIAAMRCYVAFKLGDEVDIPKEFQ